MLIIFDLWWLNWRERVLIKKSSLRSVLNVYHTGKFHFFNKRQQFRLYFTLPIYSYVLSNFMRLSRVCGKKSIFVQFYWYYNRNLLCNSLAIPSVFVEVIKFSVFFFFFLFSRLKGLIYIRFVLVSLFGFLRDHNNIF